MRITKRQKEIIKMVAQGAILASTFVAPGMAQLARLTPNEKYYNKKVIKRLDENGIIYLAGEKIKLTKKGEDMLARIETDDITISRSDAWDGVWHLVSYDIPESKKKERDYFRAKLNYFGFKQIQDSLWVFPYTCKEEIAVLCQNLGISPFVAYLNTNYLPMQSKLMAYFYLNDDNI